MNLNGLQAIICDLFDVFYILQPKKLNAFVMFILV